MTLSKTNPLVQLHHNLIFTTLHKTSCGSLNSWVYLKHVMHAPQKNQVKIIYCTIFTKYIAPTHVLFYISVQIYKYTYTHSLIETTIKFLINLTIAWVMPSKIILLIQLWVPIIGVGCYETFCISINARQTLILLKHSHVYKIPLLCSHCLGPQLLLLEPAGLGPLPYHRMWTWLQPIIMALTCTWISIA